MRIDSLHTSSFVLPNYPRVENIPFTSLCPGPDGRFAFAVCVMPHDYETEIPSKNFPLALFVIDMESVRVEEQHVSFAYKGLYQINLVYDTDRSSWLLVLDTKRNSNPNAVQDRDFSTLKLIDCYAVDTSTASQWALVRSIKQKWGHYIDDVNGGETVFEDYEPWFLSYIKHPLVFTLLVCGAINDDGLAEHCIQLMHAHTPDHSTTYELRKGHRSISLVLDTSILLFLCECPTETYEWNIHMSAFDMNGDQLASKDMIPVAYPARWEKYYVADDFWDWLFPTMVAIRGPLYGSEKVQTCVAALQLRDQPEKGQRVRRGREPLRSKEPLPEVQGGLFWIDAQGQILAREAFVFGEELTMCLCGDMVVGVDCLDGRWRLWTWSPATAVSVPEVVTKLQLEAKRLVLVPVESPEQHATPSFWLIAESTTGIQVSLWAGPDWRSIRQGEVEGVRLPNRHAQSRLAREPAGLALYQDALLVMVIDREYRLQLLRFQ